MSDVFRPGGDVFPSSQQKYVDHEIGENQFFMLGVIVSVFPSDSKDNRVAHSDQHSRGTLHVCTVLAGNDVYAPDDIIENVIIPPSRHSGMDNFEEDLPRGCSQLVDGTSWNLDGAVDYGKLDGEWCLVGFINGNSNYPFIAAWWPHPFNIFDPATSGNANDKKMLVQADVIKNRFRSIRVINGVLTLVNREGSVYLDTTQGGRQTKVENNQRVVTNYDKGGHIQVDVKKTAQLEINFNDKPDKGPRIGAGSTDETPVHDPDLPHPDQPVVGTTPQARETTRTYIRGSAYHLKTKTSGLEIVCEDTSSSDNGEKGEFSVEADDQISSTVDANSIVVDKTQVKIDAKVINTSVPVNLGADKAQQPAMLGTLFVTPFNAMLTQFSALNAKLLTLMSALATLMNALKVLYPPAIPVAEACNQVTSEISALQTNLTTLIAAGVPSAGVPAAGPGYLSPNVKLT